MKKETKERLKSVAWNFFGGVLGATIAMVLILLAVMSH